MRFLPTVELNFTQTAELFRIARRAASGSPERKTELAIAYAAREVAHPLTPIVTGSWRSAWAVVSEPSVAIMGVDPGATNPLSDEDPIEYAPEVHEMGGRSRSGHRRAVLQVVMDDHSDDLLDIGEEQYLISIGVNR